MTYKFKTGDKGKTRGGYDYEVLRDYQYTPDDRWVAVLITFTGGDQCVISVPENGLSGNSGEYDLLPPTRKVYVNFYRMGNAGWCATRGVAEAAASRDCIAIAVEVEIPCE